MAVSWFPGRPARLRAAQDLCPGSPQQKSRVVPSALRQLALLRLAIALAPVCCALGAASAFGDIDDCDMPPPASADAKHAQTQDEIERELVQQLAIKLRQFDECLDQELANSSSSAQASAAAAPGRQTQIANGGGGGQNPGDGAGQNRAGSQARERPGGAIADAGNDAASGGNERRTGVPAGHTAPGPAAPATGVSRGGKPAMPSGRGTGRDSVVEDDIARILREAAEQETDPTRRAALWKEYENYVKSL